MRLGIYGGTFDPVHFAHLLLAEQCREQLALDAVWFIPAALPPHKQDRGITSAKDRLAMLKLAIAGHPEFVVSDREIARGGTSYTIDTLRELHAEDPSRELFLLIGADSLADLTTWREPDQILKLATVVAVNRGRQQTDLTPLREQLGSATAAIVEVTMPVVDLAATDLRERVAAGKSIRYMTPRAVEQ